MQTTPQIPNYKVLVAGEPAAGKTSLIRKTVHEKFDINYVSTPGIDFETKRMSVGDRQYNLQLWDMAGQGVQTFNRVYSRDASVILILFDPIRDPTGTTVDAWLTLFGNEKPDVPYFVAATKSDMLNEDGLANLKKKRYTKSKGFYLISSLSGSNVEELINAVGAVAIQRNPISDKSKQPEAEKPKGRDCCIIS